MRVAFHEYVALWGDLRATRSWGVRARLLWHGPGWRPQPEANRP